MHDIKFIRNDPKTFSKKLTERNTNINLDNLLNLDIKNRELIKEKEKLEQEKKIISKKRDVSNFSISKKISKKIEKLTELQISTKGEIDLIISSLPNLALDDVPIGKNEKSNKEIKKFGDVTKF